MYSYSVLLCKLCKKSDIITIVIRCYTVLTLWSSSDDSVSLVTGLLQMAANEQSYHVWENV